MLVRTIEVVSFYEEILIRQMNMYRQFVLEAQCTKLIRCWIVRCDRNEQSYAIRPLKHLNGLLNPVMIKLNRTYACGRIRIAAILVDRRRNKCEDTIISKIIIIIILQPRLSIWSRIKCLQTQRNSGQDFNSLWIAWNISKLFALHWLSLNKLDVRKRSWDMASFWIEVVH